MSELNTKHDRLRHARAHAGFATASAGAIAAGVNKPTYIHHENGTRDFDEDSAKTYAKYFGVSVAWLLLGMKTDVIVPQPKAAGVTVVAAAVYHGAIISLPAPARHHTILQSMDIVMGIDTTKVPPSAQGFLTSDGKFVNRIEAFYVAWKAGQLDRSKQGPELFSEDLW